MRSSQLIFIRAGRIFTWGGWPVAVIFSVFFTGRWHGQGIFPISSETGSVCHS